MQKRNLLLAIGIGLSLVVTSSIVTQAFASSEKQDHAPEKKFLKLYERQTEKAGGNWYSYVTIATHEGTMRPVVDDQADTEVWAYSVNKLAVAVAVMDKVDRGELTLGQKLTLTPDIIAEGSGFYHLQDVYGDELTLANLMTAMLLMSDNTAVRMFGKVVPGPEINQILQSKGFTVTRVDPLPDNPNRFFLHKTTPRETHKILEGFADKSIVSSQSADFVLNIMRWVNGYNDGIRRNMSSAERIRIASKYGAFEDSRNEVGIMFDTENKPQAIYSFFTDGLGDIYNYGATNPAVEAEAVLGRRLLDIIDHTEKAHPLEEK